LEEKRKTLEGFVRTRSGIFETEPKTLNNPGSGHKGESSLDFIGMLTPS
jgi:hypothetical protein